MASSVPSTDDPLTLIDSVPFWWHSIDVGQGLVTPGRKSRENLEAELASLRLPGLKGKSVLDVGAWDGFFSFAMERAGARRVVALDHYVWSLDLVAKQEYWARCQRGEERPRMFHEVPELWRPDELPGKKGFDTAKKALGSGVESVVGDLMELDLEELGSFDVVLYKGVLYHMRHPLQALERVAEITRGMAVIETSAARYEGFEDRAVCEFFESDELNCDPTNWWVPNMKGLHSLCRAAGFRKVETVLGVPEEAEFCEGAVFRYRAVVHAWM